MTTLITEQQVRDRLITLARERGNESNPRPGGGEGECYYTVPNGGHCVAGQTLVDLGIPVPEWGDSRNCDSIITLAGTWLRDLGVELDAGATFLLDTAQCLADDGDTWAGAINKALEYLDEG